MTPADRDGRPPDPRVSIAAAILALAAAFAAVLVVALLARAVLGA